jgi:putative transposase
MIREHEFVHGEYYHLYNRGNSKQAIFLDDSDRDRFVKLLYLHNSNKSVRFKEDIVQRKIDAWDFDRGEQIVSIGAWVIMPNHFHIYVTPMSDMGEKGVTSFMRKLSTSYSKYFNTKHDRTGGLFEGNFKSEHVSDDNHAKYLFSYIHLNPIKIIDPKWKESGLKDMDQTIDFLNKYKRSSYKDFLGEQRSESAILSRKNFPDYFSDKSALDKEMFDWLTYNPPMSDMGKWPNGSFPAI